MSQTDGVLEKAEALKLYNGPDRVVLAEELKEIIKSQPQRNKVRLYSGLNTLDICIGGFHGGEVTTISGLTGNGKTTLAQTFTNNFYARGEKSLWFSYEVQAEYFMDKFGPDMPNFTMPLKLENSLSWLNKRIWESKLKFGTQAVFIDHLHYLLDMGTRNNMSLEIGRVMRELKKIALRYNIALFLIAHVGKTKLTKDDVDGLELADIRDSSFIGQESDNVLLVWRTTNPEGGALLKIAKDRKFGTFNKIIGLQKQKQGYYLREVEKKVEKSK